MSPRARVAVVGLGPIGIEVARGLVDHPALELAAAADVSPQLAGKPLDELVPGAPAHLIVDASLAVSLARGVAAVALCTGSRIASVADDLSSIAAAGAHAVTTCEELAAPPGLVDVASPSPDAARVRALDEQARRAGVSLLATGVNPGFVMDRWPLQLAAMCVRVRGVEVVRIVDAAKRREPLRRKVGHGLTAPEFRAGVAAGRLGHVGLRASAMLLGHGLGTSLARADETIEPVLDDSGRVLGVRQHLDGTTTDHRPISLHLEMWVGARDPHDRVLLDADPPLDVRIDGGTHGDRATVGAVLDGLCRVVGRAPRGVVSVVDVY